MGKKIADHLVVIIGVGHVRPMNVQVFQYDALVYVPNLEGVRFPGAIGIPEDYSSFAEQAIDNGKHQCFFF